MRDCRPLKVNFKIVLNTHHENTFAVLRCSVITCIQWFWAVERVARVFCELLEAIQMIGMKRPKQAGDVLDYEGFRFQSPDEIKIAQQQVVARVINAAIFIAMARETLTGWSTHEDV